MGFDAQTVVTDTLGELSSSLDNYATEVSNLRTLGNSFIAAGDGLDGGFLQAIAPSIAQTILGVLLDEMGDIQKASQGVQQMKSGYEQADFSAKEALDTFGGDQYVESYLEQKAALKAQGKWDH